MDWTIRGLDEDTFHRFKAWSSRHGKNLGEAVTKAMEAHLERQGEGKRKHHFWEIATVPGGPGAFTASGDVDRIVYGNDGNRLD